jgi:hypothetical protein
VSGAHIPDKKKGAVFTKLRNAMERRFGRKCGNQESGLKIGRRCPFGQAQQEIEA